MLTLLLVHMQSIYDSTLEGTGPMPAQGTKILNAMECSQIKTKPNQTKSRQSGMGVWGIVARVEPRRGGEGFVQGLAGEGPQEPPLPSRFMISLLFALWLGGVVWFFFFPR